MKKYLISAVFLILLNIPAFPDSFNISVGFNKPSGESDIYAQNERETTFRVSDLNGWSGSIGYDHFLGEHISIGGSISGYQQDTDVEDADFELSNGSPILRNIRLEVVPVELNLHLLPAGRDAGIIPYVGGGAGIYYWEYEEAGDFVFDRATNQRRVVTGRSYSDGTDPGWHVEGGVQIPVSRSGTVMGEYRYWSVKGDLNTANFDPDFEPIDLSGSSVSIGFAFWF